jgi:hypothetical protein
MSVLDLCSYLGLAATGFATLTLWLGLLIALRYSPQRFWPHRHMLLILLGSSLLRHQLGRPLWRRLHTLAFPTVVLVFLHSILTDPLLKDGRPDLLDGGKVFVEIACLLSVIAVAGRVVLRGKGLRQGVGRSPSQS